MASGRYGRQQAPPPDHGKSYVAVIGTQMFFIVADDEAQVCNEVRRRYKTHGKFTIYDGDIRVRLGTWDDRVAVDRARISGKNKADWLAHIIKPKPGDAPWSNS